MDLNHRALLLLLLCLFNRNLFAEAQEQTLSNNPEQNLSPELIKKMVPEFNGIIFYKDKNKKPRILNMGFSSLAQEKTSDSNTIYWIGSISKQFAAAAILKLVQLKKIDLNAPVHQYIPSLKPIQKNSVQCSAKHLLNHTCGLIRKSALFLGGDALRDLKSQELLIKRVNNSKLLFTPGTKKSYSNLAYSLVGILVQKVSGLDYQDFLKKHFFNPLNMQQTGVYLPQKAKNFNLAISQFKIPFSFLEFHNLLGLNIKSTKRFGPAGNIFSTASDLNKWNLALHNGKVFPEEIYQKIISPDQITFKGSKKEKAYGLGISLYTLKNMDLRWHNGALSPEAYNSFMAWDQKNQRSLIILSNRSYVISDASYIGIKLLKFFSGENKELKANKLKASQLLYSFLPLILLFSMLLLFSYWLFLIFKQPKSYLSWISNINAMVFVFCILFNIFRGEQSLHLTVLIFSLLSALLIHIKLKNLPKISWYLKKTEKHSAILSAVFISWVFSKMNAIQMVPIYFISFLLLALICYINRKNKVQ